MLAIAVSCSPVILVLAIGLSTVAVTGLPLEDDSDPEKIEARRTLVLSLSGSGVKHELDEDEDGESPLDNKRNVQASLQRGSARGDHEKEEEKEPGNVERGGEVKNKEENKSNGRMVSNERYKSVDRRSRSKSTTTERIVVDKEESDSGDDSSSVDVDSRKLLDESSARKVNSDLGCSNNDNCTKVDATRSRKVNNNSTPSPAAIMSRRQRISNNQNGPPASSDAVSSSTTANPTLSELEGNYSTTVKKRRRPTTVSTTPTPPTTSMPYPTFNQFPAIDQEVPQYDITQFLNFGKKISPETVPTPSGINSIESNKSVRQRPSDRYINNGDKLSYLTPEEDIVNENMDVTVMKKAIERNTAPRGRIPVRDPVISSSYYRRRPMITSTTLSSVQTTDDNLISTTECAAVDSSDTASKVYRRRSPSFHGGNIKCGEIAITKKIVNNDKGNKTENLDDKKDTVSNQTVENNDTEKEKPEVKPLDVELVNRRRILKSSPSSRNKFERLQVARSSPAVVSASSPTTLVVSTSPSTPLTTVSTPVSLSKDDRNLTTSTASPTPNRETTDRLMKFRRPPSNASSASESIPDKSPQKSGVPDQSADPLQQEESNPYPRNAKPSTTLPDSPKLAPLPISPQPTTRILSTAVVTSVSVKETDQDNGTRSNNNRTDSNVPQQSEPTALVNENQNRSNFVELSKESRIKANVRMNSVNKNQTGNTTPYLGVNLNATKLNDDVNKNPENNINVQTMQTPSSSTTTTTTTTTITPARIPGLNIPESFPKNVGIHPGDPVIDEVIEGNHNSKVNFNRTLDHAPSAPTTVSPIPVITESTESNYKYSNVNAFDDGDIRNRSIISLSSISNSNTNENDRFVSKSEEKLNTSSAFDDTKDLNFNMTTVGPTAFEYEEGDEKKVEDELSASTVPLKVEDDHSSSGHSNKAGDSPSSDFGSSYEVPSSVPSGYYDQTNEQTTFVVSKPFDEDHSITKEPPSSKESTVYETYGPNQPVVVVDGSNNSYNDYDNDLSNSAGYVSNNNRSTYHNHNHNYNVKWTSSTDGEHRGSTRPVPAHNETPVVDVSYQENLSITTYLVAALVVTPVLLLSILAARIIVLRTRRKKVLDDSEYSSEYNRSPLSTTTPSLHTKLPRLATHPSWEIEKSKLPLPPIPAPVTRWEFPREKLRLQTVLGQGNFGQVWKAEADDINGHEGLTRLVAVKTVKEGASVQQREDLLRELGIMQELGAHPNVVTLLGCCTEKEPYLLIMEYVMYGKLLAFLRDYRTRAHYYNFSDPNDALTSRDLTVFAYCVARGMDYLTSKSIIHRDLAARNVLVDHNKLCKIADFGMSRNVRDTGQIYEQRQCKGALPIRWMAPESLHFSLYTHKTDVWSFGILMWEIVTLGSTPYASMGAREVMRRVRSGYRLDRPAHCHQELFRVVTRCWHSEPAKRPTFAELKQELAQLLADSEHAGNYVDLESLADQMRQSSGASTLQRP